MDAGAAITEEDGGSVVGAEGEPVADIMVLSILNADVDAEDANDAEEDKDNEEDMEEECRKVVEEKLE